MKNIRFICKMLVTVMIFGALIVLMGSCGSSEGEGAIFNPKTIIDAKEYITVNYGKYDGYSSPSISVNYELLSKQIDAEKFNSYTNTLSPEIKWEMEMYDTPSNAFDIGFAENYDNISNGDSIIVKIGIEPYLESEGLTLDKFCNGLDIKFKDTQIEYTVSGLEEPQNIIDIFEGIEKYIEFKGANGYGRAYSVKIPDDYSKQIDDIFFVKDGYNSVKVIHINNSIGGFSYNVSGEKLSGGDTIELSASYFNTVSELEKLGYIVPTTTKNIEVPALGEYLTSQEQLTPDVLEAIKSELQAKRGIETIDKLYYTTFKPGVECTFNSTSFIFAIFNKSGWFGGYYIDELNDIIINPDGSVTVESYKQDSWSDDTLDKAVECLATNRYDFVELN